LAAILCNEGLVLMIFGIVGIIEGLRLNGRSEEAGDAFGPGWYLIILSLVLIVCGLYYILSTFKGRDKKTEAALVWDGPASFAIVAMILSCALLPYIGYFLSTAAFLLVCTRLFGEKSWVKSILIAGLAGAVFWGVFVYLAQIPMP
jgi:putative tricarboxylic transport membrane protein